MSGNVDVNRLLESQRYQTTLKAERQTLMQQAQLLAQEIERRQQAVQAAEQEVRKLEHLDARLAERHRQGTLRAERRELDDLVVRRHTRQTEQ